MSIQSIIITNVEKLTQQLIPTISQVVEKTGIQNIGQPNMQMPSTCLPQNELQNILNLRNSLIDKLNTTSKTIDSLSKSLNPLSTIVDTTSTTLKTIRTTRIAANAGLALITPPLVVPGAIPAAINIAKDLEELLTPQVTVAKNSITSITTALDYTNSIFLKLKNLLLSIDQYLIGCGVNTNDLTPLDNKLQQLEESLNNINTDNNTYKGFILEIIEEPYSPTVNRRKAIAKNTQGIILLSSPLTFSTENQVLINEIKLLIDSNNLKAD
jgi:hypothetical protein